MGQPLGEDAEAAQPPPQARETRGAPPSFPNPRMCLSAPASALGSQAAGCLRVCVSGRLFFFFFFLPGQANATNRRRASMSSTVMSGAILASCVSPAQRSQRGLAAVQMANPEIDRGVHSLQLCRRLRLLMAIPVGRTENQAGAQSDAAQTAKGEATEVAGDEHRWRAGLRVFGLP